MEEKHLAHAYESEGGKQVLEAILEQPLGCGRKVIQQMEITVEGRDELVHLVSEKAVLVIHWLFCTLSK